MSFVDYEDPRSFYEMANAIVNEKCKINTLKLKGLVAN
jgi:hypothetical protein